MHPVNCRCIVCLVDRSSFGTEAAKAARASVTDEQARRIVERANQIAADEGPTPTPTEAQDAPDEES